MLDEESLESKDSRSYEDNEKKINYEDNNNEVNKRDIKWRQKYKEEKAKLLELENTFQNSHKELSGKIDILMDQNKKAENRAILSEIKAIAMSEGISDIDLIKLVDISNIKMENGEIIGAKEAIMAFKNKKPAFFEKPKKVSSSSNHNFSAEDGSVKQKSAFDIPKDEWNKLMGSLPISK